ncbi:hypothetical protein [Microbulbifer epialgicus]|uniref:DUF2846 domain-containing protein n=1 Tax=Microbulbifer epialgicus TaxID=393907 RepID=A0ABV4P1K7_9GAMM
MRKFILIVLVVILSGCASLENIEYQGEDAGYLVITSIIGQGAQRDGSYIIMFRESANYQASHRLYYSPGNLFYAKPPDFTNHEGKGFVHIVKLKPGSYQLHRWYAANNNWSVSPDEYVVTEFEVFPSKTTYGGAYIFKPFKGKNLLGMSVFGGLEFVPSPDIDRDHEIAVAKKPEISSLELINAKSGSR